MKSTLKHQQGVAIITAVAVAALVAAVASFMGWQFSLWLRQVENQHDLAQARTVARAAIDYSRFLLRKDARETNYDHAGEAWAVPINNLTVEQGMTGGSIHEAQGKFNLNNLINNGLPSEQDVAVFRRLLTDLNLSPDLANAVLDWIDIDAEVRFPGGAEDGDYLGLTPPYRAANMLLQDLSELRRIKGFTPEVITALKPFVTVLPQQTQVNVNFAPPELLAALVPGLSTADAAALAPIRTGKPFDGLEAFRVALPQNVAENFRGEAYTVGSRYFQIDSNAKFGRVTVSYSALVERNGDTIPRLIWLARR
ncbi:type II secretion system minor pseudopilin GspK [Parachitinimonas caeni]|uniref:Type II secretion system protein K n=1 Tax=Parachitinimonas caeni TaxID=3031301 RepID=A0ABT7E3E8_9NEIS|nr:type II secretion system minor pseudopilin GspK [Parachitinimonas caeni]MDK2125843.1 type II secretion system minor pseudopilin GspK [Parachitinimonas caeni]